MLLAEALIYRKELKSRLDYTGQRLVLVSTAREGRTPVEDPQELLAQFVRELDEYQALITAIHKANLVARVQGGQTVTEAIVQRDMMDEKMALLRKVDESVAERTTTTWTRRGEEEVPFVATIDVGQIRQEVSGLAKARRQLDVQIQRANWQYEVEGYMAAAQ